MKIVTLAYTSAVNWPSIDTFSQRTDRGSVIRYLDQHKIAHATIYAQIVGLEFFFGNKITHLSKADHSLNHISFTFGVECDATDLEIFNDIRAYKDTIYFHVKHMRYAFLTMTMTLKELVDNIISYSQEYHEHDIRLFFNDIYHFLMKNNLGELFASYDVVNFGDDTFTLVKE